jgi:hypothetical protein
MRWLTIFFKILNNTEKGVKIKKIINTSIIKVRIFCRSQKFATRGICPFRPLP